MLKLIQFIKENNDWEEKLSQSPYAISIKRKDNFIMFSYNQIESDFNEVIVRECRGLILEDKTFKPLCVPFYKFGNYGEGYVDRIDWSTAVAQEKIDGSIIKVWNYNDDWKVSTNGTIDAHEAGLTSDISIYNNFYDLFMKAVENNNLDILSLNKNYTYMFELVSPYNRVVVPYTTIDIYHIGTRNINTLEELNVDIGIKKPKIYNFKSLEDCIKMAESLPFNEEGYVVVDKNWHRNKVKSPAYIAAHYIKNNGIITKVRIVSLIRINEHNEFLNYYPEFTEAFNEVNDAINSFIIEMNTILTDENKAIEPRKEFALFATKTRCPALLFQWKDGYVNNAGEWLWKQSDDRIVKWINL